MTLKNMFSSIADTVPEYINTTIKTNDGGELRKIKKLFNQQLFEARSFADSQLDILTFDWQSLERDRNWWWQLQALPFLNWYTGSFSLQSKQERTNYFSHCLNAIGNWCRHARDNQDSPLVWHDHAAAFRVRNLANWLVFCHIQGLPVTDDLRVQHLGELIVSHLNWMQQEQHYSKHTNHGFDQAMIALVIANIFADEQFEGYRQLNRARLLDEIAFAFTEQGVHKENSPGYQKTMLVRLRQLRAFRLLGEQEIAELAEGYIRQAEDFLQAVTLPNGFFPMIGDTRDADPGTVYQQQDQIDILDYSTSGYVILRGALDSGLEFFLLFKSTHESNYHRHDDDLMIYLYVDGEVVLGDAGLGMHLETDLQRQHLRSVYAHSVPLIDATFIRQREKLATSPTLELDRDSHQIRATSHGFGKKVTRLLDYSRLGQGELRIEDACESAEISNNWFFGDHLANLVYSGVELNFSRFRVSLQSDGEQPIQIIRGWQHSNTASSSLMSENYGEFTDATRCVIGGNERVLNVELTITMREQE